MSGAAVIHLITLLEQNSVTHDDDFVFI